MNYVDKLKGLYLKVGNSLYKNIAFKNGRISMTIFAFEYIRGLALQFRKFKI